MRSIYEALFTDLLNSMNRWCASYLYFNNSWSTIENIIAGRPWLILN